MVSRVEIIRTVIACKTAWHLSSLSRSPSVSTSFETWSDAGRRVVGGQARFYTFLDLGHYLSWPSNLLCRLCRD